MKVATACLALAAGVALALSVGCTSSAGVLSDGTPADGASSNAATISREAYEAGFRAYRSCMEEIGYPIQDVEEVNSVYKFLIPLEAATAGGDQCYNQEFQDLDIAWQTQDVLVEQSEEARLLRTCLESLGLPPADTQEERLSTLRTNGYTPMTCLENAESQ